RDAVDQSKIRLQRQPYFQSVDDHLSPVAGTDDMVDLDYDVKEMNANQVRASIGYSQLNKVILGGSLDMPDFFGTGNLFNTSVQLSRPFQSLNFTYTEPYFTPDAIQQSINVYLTHVDNQDRDIADYTTNSVGGTLSYAIPLNADDYFNLGGGYDFTNLQQPSGYTSYVVKNFLQDNPGGNYNSLIVVTGLSRNTTNNAYFPTQGVNASATLKASVPGSDLTWYKILLDAKWYHALWKRGYSVEVDGDLDYGGGYGKTKSLPFFNNFFGGGWGSVRGFDPGSLGPRDSTQCNNTDPTVCPQDVEEGQAIGGNLLIDANFNFYFPVPFITYSDTYRMGVFADMGNVYETPSLAGEWNQGSMPTFPSLSNLRYSVGVSFEWQMPMIGLIGLSLAKPLNTRADDDSTWFNFTIGNTF
ncbi:MAG: outer membrane protein assembly factor BamA, partial [Gammaproteobacteria bacterium]|nr:outer membrane protein assembly factor BamA [Gammaproteobacteria bacterium]